MTTPSAILEVDDADFEREVLARSREVPIVVDFWAPWCGPCRALGPVLERVACDHAGAFLLAKVDVDRAQGVAARFGVRSIPLVVGFLDAEPVAQFVGAQPEAEVRRFVASLLPSEAWRLAREADGLAASDPTASGRLYREAFASDPHCGPARLGLARSLAASDVDAALELLDGVTGTLEKEACQLAATLRTGRAAGQDESTLRAVAEASPRDPAARLVLGRLLAADGRFEEALTELVASVRCDASHADGAARKAVLDVFELLGAQSPLTNRFRRELAAALYR